MENEALDYQDDTPVVILTDEEGNEKEFLIVETFELNGNRNYAVLIEANEETEDGFIMRIEEDEDGMEYLVDIEDEEEWKSVVAAYEKLVQEEEEGLH